VFRLTLGLALTLISLREALRRPFGPTRSTTSGSSFSRAIVVLWNDAFGLGFAKHCSTESRGAAPAPMIDLRFAGYSRWNRSGSVRTQCARYGKRDQHPDRGRYIRRARTDCLRRRIHRTPGQTHGRGSPPLGWCRGWSLVRWGRRTSKRRPPRSAGLARCLRQGCRRATKEHPSAESGATAKPAKAKTCRSTPARRSATSAIRRESVLTRPPCVAAAATPTKAKTVPV